MSLGRVEACVTGKYNALLKFPDNAGKREFSSNAGCIVGRVIVYHDHFVGCDRLGGNSFQTEAEMALFVVGWYNYTNAYA
jgi:hypothetical protein